MEYKSAISELFTYIDNNDIHSAKQTLKRVKDELSFLKEKVAKTDKGIIEEIEKLVKNIDKGQIDKARGKYRKTRAAFDSIFSGNREYLQPTTNATKSDYTDQSRARQKSLNGSHVHYSNANENRREDEHIPNTYGTSSEHNINSSTSTNPQAASQFNHGNNALRKEDPDMSSVEMRRQHQINEDLNYKKIQQSKRASQAMVQNNPDIADLSDVNRPTKIAERFSELYDNEWTEAFEALCKIKKGTLTEPEIIEILLEIVEKAYTFCLEETNDQIEKMELAMLGILKGGKGFESQQPAQGRDLLIQYRKGIADLALERLQKKFRDKLNEICNSRLQNNPANDGPTAKYARKAVELSWWMCVQDPPVHMCMKSEPVFNPQLYRAYTRSGSEPIFFVWPALKLHKDGGVLLKGVVQFK